jgi:Transglutaminase-like superfamily
MIDSVLLKPGVLFVQTPSGATLMDLAGDRFLSLGMLSAHIWSSIATGRSDQAITTIMRLKKVDSERAQSLLGEQLKAWEKAGLVNPADQTCNLPRVKPAPTVTPRELPAAALHEARLSLRLMAELTVAQRRCQTMLRRRGLADTLAALQQEQQSGSPETADATIARAMKSYHALRRAFRQGRTSRDCLIRSLGLAAVLRRYGTDADLCIGIVDMPFASHAWVEAAGFIVNEPRDTYDRYAVIGRF